MLKLAITYTLFALAATLINFSTQEAIGLAYSGYLAFEVALIMGTITGLLCKYFLDKRYIFSHYNNNTKRDVFTFGAYAAMGLITTAIFWIFEYSFEYLFDSKTMRYTGGTIGLSIGYYTKYQLDKRYVFITKVSE